MKKAILYGIMLMLAASCMHAKNIGKVRKVHDGFVLIQAATAIGKPGDVIAIKRQGNDGFVQVGTVKVVRVVRNRVGAKILKQQPGAHIKPGDVVTDGNDSISMASLFSEDETEDSRSALEKLMLLSNPYYGDDGPVHEDMTALEKIWLDLQ